jgi:serine/threonine-protein kinase
MDYADSSTIAEQIPEAAPHDGARREEAPWGSRYQASGKLGAGAMGEVALCEDRRIGREVALKSVSRSAKSPMLRRRFIDEARIQARLDHPSIVPVYDIGYDANGNPYFTMKRVRGRTLREVIDGLKSGDAAIDPQHYTRRRLLSSFATICLTVHFSHTRGVLHRDLKPSNVMLGEYGEIYVLDWGVAREATASEEAEGPTSDVDVPSEPALTAAGGIVGTPGYIAPEHLRAEAVDARADVYSLGAILFEILTLERLNAPGRRSRMFVETLSGADRPSRRVPERDIPPELDAICARATALEREDRYASARELHDAVDRYLEGDRDTERRREEARESTKRAAELAEAALASAPPDEETRLRSQAIAEISRALAFDPTNAQARRLLVRLLTEPPRALPEPVKRDLELRNRDEQRRASRGGALLYGMFFAWAPVLFVVAGERKGGWYVACLCAAFAVAGLTLWRGSKLPYAVSSRSYLTLASTSLALSALSGLCGHLLLVPSLVMTNAIGFLMRPEPRRRRPVLLFSVAAIAVPQVLEWTGLVPPSMTVEAGRVVIMPRVLDFTVASNTMLFFVTLGFLVVFGLFFSRLRQSLAHAEERLSVQAWQLQQLLPDH